MNKETKHIVDMIYEQGKLKYRTRFQVDKAEGDEAGLDTEDVDVAVWGALQSVTEETSVEDNMFVARPRVQHGQ